MLKREKKQKKIVNDQKNIIKADQKAVERISFKIKAIKKEISKAIIGQEKVVDSLIRALLCGGHILLEGVPGIAKTLIIRTLGISTGCKTGRIQFTVDLLPSDIIGLTMYKGEKAGFEVIKGPIFSNFLIADEINRAPPKTQSALLEAMQEKQVTIGRNSYNLDLPFFVMATQNPIESAGVYNLPEAQIDRFLFKILMSYPRKQEEKEILDRNIDQLNLSELNIKNILSPKDIISAQKLVKKVYISEEIRDYILNIVECTRASDKPYSKYIDWGASPRASIGLFIASKAEALTQGRNYVVPQDIKNIAHDVLRHRILLGYEAEVDKVTADSIIDKILSEVVVP